MLFKVTCSDSKIHGANVRPTWGRQEPGGTHVGHTTLAIWDTLNHPALCLFRTEHWSLCLHIFITYSWHIFNTISQHVLTLRKVGSFLYLFLQVLSAHEAALTSVTLSNSDMTHALSGSADGGLLVWCLDTGRLLHRLTGHTNSVTAVRTTDTQNLGVSGLYCNAK